MIPPAAPLPVAAAAGYPVPPVVIVAGVVTTIPTPVQLAGPVPIPLPWCVLQNNSPFTLLVSQGQVLTQIAPFTMDRVQVNNPDGLTGLTVLGQLGNGTVSPSSDSVVNATWYAAPPDGAYPAALGSGSVVLTSQTAIIPQQFVIGAGTTFGPLDVSNYAGLSVSCLPFGVPTPICDVDLQWENSLGQQTGQRGIRCGGSPNNAEGFWQVPNYGPNVTVAVTLGAGSAEFGVQGISSPVQGRFYDDSGAANAHSSGILLDGTQVIPGTTTVTLDSSTWIYNGPASWYIDTNASTNWSCRILYMDDAGAYQQLFQLNQGSVTQQFTFRDIIVPARPLRFQWINSDAVNRSPAAKLMVAEMLG